MSTPPPSVYQDSIGVNVLIRTGQPLLNLDIDQTVFRVKKPSGAYQNWSVNIYGEPSDTDGYLQHITEDGDIDEYGEYQGQALLVYDDGGTYYGAVVRFTIAKNEVFL